MQVKPRFKKYRFLEQHPIITDDTGNEMCLTLVEGDLEKFWVVIGKNQQRWSNGAISYHEYSFWKSKVRKLIEVNVNGMKIKEKEQGQHYVFSPLAGKKEFGLKTSFEIL